MKLTIKPLASLSGPQPKKLAFPANVLLPQKSQLDMSKDGVAEQVRKLCLRGEQIGSKLGVTMRGFDIGELIEEKRAAALMPGNEATFARLSMMFVENMEGRETLSLEPRNGSWGIFYHRTPGTSARQPISVPLVDAPLPVRMRFCAHSFRFFEEYLKTAGITLEETKTAAESARRTLEALDNIEAV